MLTRITLFTMRLQNCPRRRAIRPSAMLGYKRRTRINDAAMRQQYHRFCGRLVTISERCHGPRSPTVAFSQASIAFVGGARGPAMAIRAHQP